MRITIKFGLKKIGKGIGKVAKKTGQIATRVASWAFKKIIWPTLKESAKLFARVFVACFTSPVSTVPPVAIKNGKVISLPVILEIRVPLVTRN